MSLHIESLEFSYGSKKVLHQIDVDADDGEVVSILGPNGVGKTTLLKCICRVHRPDSGSISVDGEDITSLPGRELAKRISYVPQRAYTSLTTVYDTILIGRKPHVDWALSKEDIDMVWRIIRLFRMEDMALKYIDEISGGELQKVQIARAMAQDAHVMVLDEPTNNLDVANQHMIMHLIRQLAEKKGMCAVMTMHDINIALQYSDRFIFVKDGRILSCGGEETVTPEIIREVYGIDADIIDHDGGKVMVPRREQPCFLDIDVGDLCRDDNDPLGDADRALSRNPDRMVTEDHPIGCWNRHLCNSMITIAIRS